MTKRLEQGTMMPGTLQKTTELLSFSDVERGLGKLIFAYVLWMEVRNEAVEETHQPDHRNVPGSRHAESQGAEGEVIFPWILLAIIRQLSMIREMGKSRYAGSTKKQGNTKSKPKIPADDRFPDHGIIFSAVLHDRMKYIAAAQADTRLFIYG